MKKIFVNKIIRNLVKADLMFLSAFGLITPIFAVFITEQIKGGDIKVVGFAAATYWISKSLFQIPIGRFLDKERGEKDDIRCLVAGFLIAAMVPFAYIFSSFPWHIYALQVIYGLGMAMYNPAWCAIFTRHIDKGKEAFEWSLNSSSLGFGIGITGAVGGILASQFGFNLIFILVGIFAILGGLLPLLIYKDIVRLDHNHIKIPESKKPPLS